VRYQDLVSNPMGVIRAIYEHFELELTVESEQLIAAWADANRQDRYREEHGSHEYSPNDFGLDVDAIDAEYSGYRACLGLELRV
jgi:hypothetical protein